MAGLGHLERAVMDALWSLPAASLGDSFPARAVAETLPDHAYTTILTVLDRLTRKGFVERMKDGKTHHYRATGSRESYIAQLMREALDATSDVGAALVHFVETAPRDQAELLREALDRRSVDERGMR